MSDAPPDSCPITPGRNSRCAHCIHNEHGWCRRDTHSECCYDEFKKREDVKELFSLQNATIAQGVSLVILLDELMGPLSERWIPSDLRL